VRCKEQKIAFLTTFLIIFLLSTSFARAYIDPGTGSYMLQLAIAFFVGALFTLKVFWKKIIAFLKTTFSKKNKDGDTTV
jgi:hypothetical protein